MESSSILASLALLTILSGLAVGTYQLWSVKRATRQGSHVDGTKARPNA